MVSFRTIIPRSRKLKDLAALLEDSRFAAVAFSGGVDSSFLLKAAIDVLGTANVLAFHVASPLQHEFEKERAMKVAAELGAKLCGVSMNQLSWPEFTANPKSRCYLCKKKIYACLQGIIARENRKMKLMDGTNADDLLEVRPGIGAIREHRVLTPLAGACLTKEEIRKWSHAVDLPTWKQPTSSCLATRIPYGSPITEKKLAIVKKAEEFLISKGYHGCRFRVEDPMAIIEVGVEDLPRITEKRERLELLQYCQSLGFKRIFIDLHGRAMA